MFNNLLLLSVVAAVAVVAVRSDDEAAQYQFEYRVTDELSGQDFGQEETRAGYNTAGEYDVYLPDGRRQIVRYTVKDPTSGYIADVQYQGEAKFSPESSYSSGPGESSYSSGPGESSYSSETLKAESAYPPIRIKPTIPSAPESRVEPLRAVQTLVPRPTSKIAVKKMIHQYKEVATTTSAPPPQPAIYIPSRTPKTVKYTEKLHASDSKILISLFREDIKEKMTPPSKEERS